MPRFATLFVLSSLIGLVGCGGSGAKSDAQDQFAAAAKRIVGRWQGTLRFDDAKAMKVLGKEAFEALKSMKMDIVFKDTGKMSMSADVVASGHSKHGEGTASWEVVKEDGDTIYIESTDDQTLQKDTVVVTFTDKSKFTIPYRKLGVVEYQRVPQTAKR